MSERSGMTCGLLAAVSSGSTLVLPSFDPALDPATALETVAAERVTVFEGVAAAASVPLALDEAVRDGRIKRGDMLLLEAFGGGFTWGSALIKF